MAVKKGGTKQDIRRYHFIGIGGMGMGNLALLMLAKGFLVSGSDIKETELTRALREKGAKISLGHHVRNIQDAECVVYSSAISASNPEMFEAVRQDIPILKRAELLARLVNKEVGITVAGAHGKTTTSSMVSLLLINAGLKPTTAIGGIVGQGYNASLGIGRHMVAEVDESDGSFLYFKPHFSIITNIDFEHVDYYQTWNKIREAYARFVECTVPGGVVIACGDDENLWAVLQGSDRRHVTYGFADNNDWVARNIACDANGSAFDCFAQGKFVGRFELTAPGKHNILNAMAVAVLGHELKVDSGIVAETLKSFRGVRRRFEKKGEINDILVVDDYGHHPTEIAVTLQAARTLDRKRLIVVFQPHRYTRTKFLMEEFADCFNLADYLVLTDIYPASEKPIEGVSTAVLLEKIRERRPRNLFYLKKEEILNHLLEMCRPGDLVLTLGAGDVTTISDEILGRISERTSLEHALSFRSYASDDVKAFGTIGVIMGGSSSEREISLKSGNAVLKALTDAGCEVKALDLTAKDRDEIREWIRAAQINGAFIALHGRFGEDGVIQSILDDLRIPYNGCGPAASYAAFNKGVAQKHFEAKGVRSPKTLALKGGEAFDHQAMASRLGGFPIVIKPACEGSSIGVSYVSDLAGIKAAIDKACEYGEGIIAQQMIKGRELTVSFLGHQALPVVEIRPQANEHSFFDFFAKYKDTTTQYLVPAPLSAEATRIVQEEALKAYQALGCEGFGRVDILLDGKNLPYVLEVNTIPGFTSTSLLPKAAATVGLNFQQLCLMLIDMAYGKKKAESAAPQQ